MSTDKKTAQATPEQRERINKATTKEDRLRVVSERTSPNFTNGRKALSLGFAFNKGSEVYKLVEEMSHYLGYPCGAELNEETNRVVFKKTKEDGMIQWRANESVVNNASEVLRAIITAVITSEDPSFLSQVRQATVTSSCIGTDAKTKVNDFYRDLEEYRNATASIREEKKMTAALDILSGLSQEQIQKLLASKSGTAPIPAAPLTA